jgi:UDP-N-acetylmuramate dehydrogenase
VVRQTQNDGGSDASGLDGRDLNVTLSCDEPLSKHSSLRVGGSASVWAEPNDRRAVEQLVRWAIETDRSWYVVGLGSNVLFPDEGIDGLVMKLSGECAAFEVASRTESDDGETRALVDVGAGVVNAHLVRSLLKDGWVGAEFLSLIPGTFGGAVAMNAGTKEASLKTILRSVTLLRTHDGIDGADSAAVRTETLTAEELGLAYRHSDLPDGALVLGGTIEVTQGDAEAARQRMEADRQRREKTQPYRLPSVGSTFANPDEGYAGELIERVGLKGATSGGAKISDHHANFFINDDDATAEDFLRLMARARCRVREREGIELRPEVQFVGFDGMERLRRLEAQFAGEARRA